MRIENNFKEQLIEKTPILNQIRQYISLLNSPNFDAAKINYNVHLYRDDSSAVPDNSVWGVLTTFVVVVVVAVVVVVVVASVHVPVFLKKLITTFDFPWGS